MGLVLHLLYVVFLFVVLDLVFDCITLYTHEVASIACLRDSITSHWNVGR
jgi:hypothetical protein